MKRISILLLIMTLSSLLTMALAQTPPSGFPFFRSFLDGKTDGIVKTDEAVLTNKGMQLTDKVDQVGGFYLPGREFITSEGLMIEFEYMMYNGTGVTDGITMFLAAASSNLVMGAKGAGFGYTYNWTVATHSGDRKSGVNGAYICVGLDQGTFKEIRFQGEELRNGIPYRRIGQNSVLPDSRQPEEYDTASNITIRGAAGRGTTMIGTTRQMEEGFWGYPVLITRHTGGSSDPNNMRNTVSVMLNTSTGDFVKQDNPPYIDQPFNIASGTEFVGPEQTAYRKAIIRLEPNTGTNNGFNITVTIQHGQEKTVVIENFTWPATIRYMENAQPLNLVEEFPRAPTTSPKVTYTVPTPDKLVIGFTGSTGVNAYTNVIKNLRITPSNGASTANDDIRNHRRGPATVRPFDNDTGCKKESDGTITVSKDNLDPQTFRFWANESTPLGEGVFEYTAGEGKWRYDPVTNEVIFFPNKGFIGTAWMLYDVKAKAGTSFDDEMFRSSLATISVTVVENPPV